MVSKKTAVSLAIGSAFVASIAVAPLVNAADNPFAMESLEDGYQVAATDAVEQSNGNTVKFKKRSDRKRRGFRANRARKAKKAQEAKAQEAKCGEARCGGSK